MTAEHKKDKRTIEETLMDIRAKKQKTAHSADSAEPQNPALPLHNTSCTTEHHGDMPHHLK